MILRRKNRILTYKELYTEVCRFVQVLKNNGVQKGDRVCIYMPMIPELAIAVLACARMGAIHSVVFGGYSSQSIADRIEDARCRIVITADGGNRGSKDIRLKATIDEALLKTAQMQKVIVYKHLGIEINMEPGRDCWWQDELKKITQDDITGRIHGGGRHAVHPLYFRFYRQTERSGAQLRGLYDLYHLQFCKCVSIQTRRNLFLYGRCGLDHRT